MRQGGCQLSLRQLSGLVRRQAAVVLIVFLVLLGIAYSFKKASQIYSESGTLVLMAAVPNPYSTDLQPTLVNTGELLVKWINGPDGQAALHKAGVQTGTGIGLNIGLVNFYSEQFPDYQEPYMTVSVAEAGVANDAHAFIAALHVFDSELAHLQNEAGIKHSNFIKTRLIGDSGPMVASGSSKRVYGGLAIIGVVVAFLAAAAFDRRGVRLRLRTQPRAGHA